MDKEILEGQVKLVEVKIPKNQYNHLLYLGILKPINNTDKVRNYNVGNSNYANHVIQPWSIWLDYPELSSFDHDIIKRVLRTKIGETRRLDYEKIIHICKECIRQINIKDDIELDNMKGNA